LEDVMLGSRGSLFFCSLLLGAACGDGGSLGPATEPGRSIAVPSMHTLVVQNAGGGPMQQPAGSTCAVGAQRYSLTLGSPKLSWARCVGSSTMAYHEVSGNRLLTTQEFNDFQVLMQNLKVVNRDTDMCLTGQPVLSVEVYTAAGDQKYVDDGSQCAIKDKPVVERAVVVATLSRLNQLAGP
jgi:hypothetical protein